jgi:CubicO group peptidase (beta-lactamase class C family)
VKSLIVALSVAVSALVLQPRPAAPPFPTLADARQALESNLPQWMSDAKVPGLAIAIVDNGQVAWAKGFGVLKAREDAPVTERSRFQAASLTKPVTAYIALQLADAGRLSLDEPLTKYVKYADLPDDPRVASITARFVLSHRTGFANWRRNDALRLFFAPGERFSYSGEGYVYLQRAIEAITCETFDVTASKMVFRPLKMNDSSMLPAESREPKAESRELQAESREPQAESREPKAESRQPGAESREPKAESREPQAESRQPQAGSRQPEAASRQPAADLAMPHTDIGTSLRPRTPPPTANAAASLVTSIADYATFIVAVTRGERLKPETARLMFTPQVQLEGCTQCTDKPRADPSTDLAWGLGWGLEDSSAGRLAWHWGDNGGYKNYVLVTPDGARGFVFFTNSDSGLALRDRITAAVIGGTHPAARLLTYKQLE